MNTRNRSVPGLAKGLPGLARGLPALAGRADKEITDRFAATHLERLRARFPGWRITRTPGGTFRARHRSTGARLQSRTLAQLEKGLHEWRARRATRGGTGHRRPADPSRLTGPRPPHPANTRANFFPHHDWTFGTRGQQVLPDEGCQCV
jgi:hypothetical protein